MAAFNKITLPATGWVDINTLSGVPVGTAFNIQNVSTGSCLLQEKTTSPTDDNGGVLYPPQYDSISKASVAAGSEKMWAKLVNGSVILAIYE